MVDPDAEKRDKLKDELEITESTKRKIKNQLSAPGKKVHNWVQRAKIKIRNLQTKSDKLKMQIGVINKRLKSKRVISRRCHCSDEQPCPYMIAAQKLMSEEKFQSILTLAGSVSKQESKDSLQ